MMDEDFPRLDYDGEEISPEAMEDMREWFRYRNGVGQTILLIVSYCKKCKK